MEDGPENAIAVLTHASVRVDGSMKSGKAVIYPGWIHFPGPDMWYPREGVTWVQNRPPED